MAIKANDTKRQAFLAGFWLGVGITALTIFATLAMLA
jgi:hypothetical protein